jgi:hypothetical protein
MIGGVAHSVEQGPFKPTVPGSIPGAPTKDPFASAARPSRWGASLGRVGRRLAQLQLGQPATPAIAAPETRSGRASNSRHSAVVPARSAGRAFDRQVPDLIIN